MNSANKEIKICCALSYIYILWIVGLLSFKENNIVKFHVNQGIILSIFMFCSLFVIRVLSYVFYYIAPVLASVTALLQLLWLFFSVFFIVVGINNALKQKQKPLPLIGELFTVLH